MNSGFTTETNGEIIVTTFHEQPDLPLVKSAMRHALEKGNCTLRLWDFAKGINLPMEDIIEIANIGKELWPKPSKGAIVVPDDLSFGLMRMHDAYREKEEQETRTFRTRSEAFAWLGLAKK